MTTTQTLRLLPGLAAVAGGFALLAPALHGAPFIYTAGDLVLAFRQTGSPSDYVVNIGKATNYNALPPGSSIIISNLSVSQLDSAFPTLNGLRWSVAGANRPPIDPAYPLQTLWVARPRLDAAEPATPWLRRSQASQGNVGSQIDNVGEFAEQASANLPAGPDNTETGVLVPVNINFNISQAIGVSGNYANHFQGGVENLTPDDFESAPANVSRSDLFELLPGTLAGGTINTPGRPLGYFELKPDGTLTFNTTATAPVTEISGVNREGDVTTLTFPTVSGVTYQLRATDAAGLTTPVSAWTAGATVSGDGNPQSLQDTNTGAIRFFVIEAQP